MTECKDESTVTSKENGFCRTTSAPVVDQISASPPRVLKKKRKSVGADVEPAAKRTRKSFRESEELVIRLNVYDLVWDTQTKKTSNAGLAELGFGFYHTGLELWGKELSYGHSKRFKSGVFALKPRSASQLMPHTRFRESIKIDKVYISRYSVDKILNRMSVRYASEAYHVLRNNCNHFTEELCLSICGKSMPEWINRPARIGTSALDVLNAPFEAIANIFTPSKKANVEAQGRDSRLTKEQLKSIGEIPADAEQIGTVNSTCGSTAKDSIPVLRSPKPH